MGKDDILVAILLIVSFFLVILGVVVDNLPMQASGITFYMVFLLYLLIEP